MAGGGGLHGGQYPCAPMPMSGAKVMPGLCTICIQQKVFLVCPPFAFLAYLLLGYAIPRYGTELFINPPHYGQAADKKIGPVHITVVNDLADLAYCSLTMMSYVVIRNNAIFALYLLLVHIIPCQSLI